jgi:hypothetical protein
VPLCRGHHREVHRSGDEAAWWARIGIDPSTAARALWLDTHPLLASPPSASIRTLDTARKSERAGSRPRPGRKTKLVENSGLDSVS